MGNPRGPTTLCWKACDRQQILVADQHADPFLNPIVLEMVGLVGRGGASLKPHGSYNPAFKNFPKAKLAFELEMPKDAIFAADFVRGVAFLKRLERNARPNVDGRNLFVDATVQSSIRFGAPLFRPKVRASFRFRPLLTSVPQKSDEDEEEIPDDYISHDAGNLLLTSGFAVG